MLVVAYHKISLASVNWNLSYHSETAKLGLNCLSFDPCDLEIWPSKSIGIFIEPWLILRCDINCLQLKLWPVAHPQGQNLCQNWLCFVPCDLEISHSKSIEFFIAPWLILRDDTKCLRGKLCPLTRPQGKFRPKLSMFWPLWPWNLIVDLQNQ